MAELGEVEKSQTGILTALNAIEEDLDAQLPRFEDQYSQYAANANMYDSSRKGYDDVPLRDQVFA